MSTGSLGSEPFDVVVVGGGLAGHCATLAAAELGGRVVLLEKMPSLGGSTVLSGGFMAFADTPMQREAHVQDSNDLLLQDLRAMVGPDANEDLLRAYAHGQARLHEWLLDMGVRYAGLEQSSGQSVARSHQTDARVMLEKLGEQIRKHPQAQICTESRVVSLVRAELDGPVASVDVERGGSVQRIRCRGGVVLASGGFSRSEALLRLFAPAQAKAVRIGGPGNTGDGLRLAWKLGAGMRDMGQIRGTFGTHPECTTEQHEILLAFYLGAIIVNLGGRRFVDESQSYKVLGDACLGQPQQRAFQIFDQQVMEKSSPGVPLFDFQPTLERGLLVKADSLEQLAARCGLDAKVLRATVERYNSGVDAGADPDYGRDGLCHHAGALSRIDQAPFYAYLSTTALLATYCGLDVDAQARVRDVDGAPIEGLYAAGEITGGFHGQAYMTGTSLGKAAFFGRVAGANAFRRSREGAATLQSGGPAHVSANARKESK